MKLVEFRWQYVQFASKTMSFVAYCPINFFIMDSMLPLELLQILACPICKGELLQTADGHSIHCKPCGRDYLIVEGIPVLLPEQADTRLRTRCEAP